MVRAKGRTRGCWARTAVSAAGCASSAGAGRAELREAEGATGATPACVLSSSRCGRGRLLPPSLPRSLPSAPECGGTASFRAARLPPDLSARVSGGREPGRLLQGAGRGCSGFLFDHPPLRAGRCLFLETLFSALLGVSGAGVTPSPLPPHLPLYSAPPPWVAGRARPRPLQLPLPAALAFPARLLSAGRAWARSWRGGPAPARKLESFVLAPRPARRGEEGGVEAAPGRPRAGPAPAPAQTWGVFRLSLPGWVCGIPETRKTGPAWLPKDLSASSVPASPGPGLVAHLGLLRGTTAGPRAGAARRTSRSLFPAEPQFAFQ